MGLSHYKTMAVRQMARCRRKTGCSAITDEDWITSFGDFCWMGFYIMHNYRVTSLGSQDSPSEDLAHGSETFERFYLIFTACLTGLVLRCITYDLLFIHQLIDCINIKFLNLVALWAPELH